MNVFYRCTCLKYGEKTLLYLAQSNYSVEVVNTAKQITCGAINLYRIISYRETSGFADTYRITNNKNGILTVDSKVEIIK